MSGEFDVWQSPHQFARDIPAATAELALVRGLGLLSSAALHLQTRDLQARQLVTSLMMSLVPHDLKARRLVKSVKSMMLALLGDGEAWCLCSQRNHRSLHIKARQGDHRRRDHLTLPPQDY